MFHNTMNQLQTKLPGGSGSPLDNTLQRIMQGLHETFKAESKQYKRKLNLQDKAIKALEREKLDIKKEFEHFKENEGVESYFKKFQSIVDHNDPNKSDKEIRDELITKVQNFIDDQTTSDKEIQDNLMKVSAV